MAGVGTTPHLLQAENTGVGGAGEALSLPFRRDDSGAGLPGHLAHEPWTDFGTAGSP